MILPREVTQALCLNLAPEGIKNSQVPLLLGMLAVTWNSREKAQDDRQALYLFLKGEQKEEDLHAGTPFALY